MLSSSKSRILDQHAENVPAPRAFVYVGVDGPPSEDASAPKGLPSKPESSWGLFDVTAPIRASIPQYTEEEMQTRERKAKEQGFQEAESRLRFEYEKKLTEERAALLGALKDFDSERKTYFQQVEAEVISLALAIARKILHREAQIDPLLLVGLVRVALEKVATSSKVRLRVTPHSLGQWREALAAQVGLQPQPEVVGDASLCGAQCVLETEVGTTDLSVETQLGEIEKGFLDLLAVRPKS